METADRYRRFAELEVGGYSACYREWGLGIAADTTVLALIDQLPPAKRQPNLVLAAARFRGAAEGPYSHFREWLVTHWAQVYEVALTHSTQTNEAGRMAVLLPILARLPGPLTLIEVGASAGLCLYPDRFSYRYDSGPILHPADGPSPVELNCVTTGGVPLPDALPTVVQRLGVDLNPLRVTDDDDLRWLETLIWPGQDDRLRRLRAAASIARTSPPVLVAGDLNARIADLVHAAPADSTVVVFHGAVLTYLEPSSRIRFEETVRTLPCRWISNEGRSVLPSSGHDLPMPVQRDTAQFVLALDGVPLAYTSPHGQTLDWFAHSRSDCRAIGPKE
ncbi:DUF2332 domain-containing protein [Nocardia amamiensis]|uniref:DUF2332 domain-containing protein n=1 Tax=Nocardia amamiensis TaxID=404578 RepID=UPI0008334B30|nr:DUF2332 domain-containing protein [Nocardia amamiensis]